MGGVRAVGLGLLFTLFAGIVAIAIPPRYAADESARTGISTEARLAVRPLSLPIPYRVTVDRVVDHARETTDLHPVYPRRVWSVVAGLALWVGLLLGGRAAFGGNRTAVIAVAGCGLWPTVVFASAHATHHVIIGALATAAFVVAFGWAGRRLTRGIWIGAAAIAVVAGVAGALGGGFALGPASSDPAPPFGLHRLGRLGADLWLGVFAPVGDPFPGLPRLVKLTCFALSGAVCGGVFLLVRDRCFRKKAVDPGDLVDPRDDPLGLRRPLPPPAPTAEPPSVIEPRVFACAGAGAIAVAAAMAWVAVRGTAVDALGWVVGALPLAVLATAALFRLVGSRPTAIALGIGPALATLLTIAFDVLPHYHAPSAKWSRGDVLRYDDAGHPRLSPNQVRRPGSGDLEPWGSYAAARQPAMNIGWGAPDLEFRYHDLDPRVPLQVRVTYYGGQEPGKFGIVSYQELMVGDRRIHGPIAVTFEPRELAWSLPAGAVDPQGRLALTFRGVNGTVAAVAEVWIERPWVAAKSIAPQHTAGDQVVATLQLANRDPDAAHPVEIELCKRTGDQLTRLVAQTTSKAIPAGEGYGVGIAAPPGAAATGDDLVLGLRRRDRGAWAILKGATNLGPGGEKRGDLDARDLHVASRREDSAAPVFVSALTDVPAGPYVVEVRYRSGATGEVRLLDAAGRTFASRPLAPPDAYSPVRVGFRDPGVLARIEVAFTGPGPAAVDEVALWADGDRTGFHLYPAGRVPAR